MKTFITLPFFGALLLSIFIYSCKAKYDFNEEVPLGEVPNQTNSQVLACGTGILEFDYTIVDKDFDMGILEIDNKGSCDIEVEITRQLPDGAGTTPRDELPPDIKKFTIPQGQPPRINAFTIPSANKLGKLHFKISCKGAVAQTGCQFYYKFSTGKNVGNDTPVHPGVAVNPTPVTGVPGATIPIGANKCVIPAGNEKIIKVITNRSKTDLYVTFEAVSDCACKYFVVYGEPESPNKNQKAKASPQNPAGNNRTGRAFVPKGQSVSIKITCESQVGETGDPCDGSAINFRITAKDNL